jgi:hypothetical protein
LPLRPLFVDLFFWKEERDLCHIKPPQPFHAGPPAGRRRPAKGLSPLS